MTPATDLDLDAADRLLSTTRAVRYRLDLETPVPRELVLECIALSQQAPTPVNSQTWHWVMVTDADTRAAIGGIYRQLYERNVEFVEQMGADNPQTVRVHKAAGYLAQVMADVPMMAFPCMLLDADAPPMSHSLAAATWGSILPAVWSFQLAARARGLGTVFTTLHLSREAEIAELLGLPPNWKMAALVPVAYYKGDTFKPAARPPADTITSWDRWGG
jgi:nitroreductase